MARCMRPHDIGRKAGVVRNVWQQAAPGNDPNALQFHRRARIENSRQQNLDRSVALGAFPGAACFYVFRLDWRCDELTLLL